MVTRVLILAASLVLVVVLVFPSARALARDQTQRVSPTYPTPAPSARQQCLHDTDESAEEAARRKQALAVARAINTAQMRARAETGTFLDTTTLLRGPNFAKLAGDQVGDVAPGWRLRLAAAPDGYVFAIKDTTDPCHFAFFSDDDGLIYTAQPIR